MIRSQPAAGEILQAPLQGIRIWFNQLPNNVPHRVAIEGGNGTPVLDLHTMGEHALMGTVHAELPAGDYSLVWTVGDQSGSIPFSVN